MLRCAGFWDPLGKNGRAEGCDTQSVAFFDERIGEYVLYTRQWVAPKTGETATSSMRAVRRLTTPKMCCTDKKLPGYGKQWDIETEVTVMAPDAFDNATHKPGGDDEPPLDYYGGNV